jgi:pyridoxamine 5'-phosphate oxidase
MDFNDCVAFARENPVVWLATGEGDQPRVRPLAMWFADESGFYFQIGGMKDVYRQLRKNPKIEMGFYKPADPMGTVMRVTGSVEFLNDPVLKRKVMEDRPFLKAFGLTPEHPDLVLFRIAGGDACFWTLASNLEPKKMIPFGK